MRHIAGLAGLLLLASALHAQDTTVVIVRHIAPKQDTNVVVRRLTPPPERAVAPRSAAGYPARSNGVIAKDPNIGTMLSFVFPGGGQYYAGQTGKGLAITLLSFGAPIAGFAAADWRHDDVVVTPGGPRSACNVYGPGGVSSGCHSRDWAAPAIGLGVGIVSYLYGVATAGTDVQHWNQAHGVRFVTALGRMGFAVALP